MMNLRNLKLVVTRGAGRGVLIVRKYSPEILMGMGIVGGVTSTVIACKATLRADGVLDETKVNLDKIHRAKEIAKNDSTVNYPEKAQREDLVRAYTQAGMGFVKLYWPAVTLGTVSVACILGAHGIMRSRNVALVAAYKAVEKSFSDYRKRVVDSLGVEKDREFKYGITKGKVVELEKNEEGKMVATEKILDVIDPNGISEYAKFFDNSSINWSDTPEYNQLFLKCAQQNANDMLHSRGHLFLNEVYDMLGIPRTSAGSVVGWVMGAGDDFVDFGMYDTTVAAFTSERACDTIGEQRRDFINGCERVKSILLDFNVDGTIYDKI